AEGAEAHLGLLEAIDLQHRETVEQLGLTAAVDLAIDPALEHLAELLPALGGEVEPIEPRQELGGIVGLIGGAGVCLDRLVAVVEALLGDAAEAREQIALDDGVEDGLGARLEGGGVLVPLAGDLAQ